MDNFGFGGGGFPGQQQQPVGNGAFGGTHNMDDDNMRPPSLPGLSQFLSANNNGGDAQQLASAARASLDDPMAQFQLSNALSNQLNNQLSNHQLPNHLSSQLSSQLPDQYSNQFSSQLTNQLASQYPSQFPSQLSSQLSNQLSSQLPSMGGMGGNNANNGNSALQQFQCMVPGCDRTVQANTIIDNQGGFCTYHFNTYLSMSSQIDNWDCRCGNKVYGQNERCGMCGNVKDGNNSTYAAQSLKDSNSMFASQGSGQQDANSMFAAQSLKDANSLLAGQNMKDSNSFLAGQGLDVNSLLASQGLKDASSLFASQGVKDDHSMLASQGLKDASSFFASQGLKDASSPFGGHDLKDGGSPFAETGLPSTSTAALAFKNDDNDMDVKPKAKSPKKSGDKAHGSNTSGRSQCKAAGCTKLSQSKNDGYCRNHFNQYSAPKVDDTTEGGTSWTCLCGNIVAVKKKRCGKCNKVRIRS